MHDDFSVADAIVSDYFGRGGQPAISYGIVRDGALAHAAGFGARVLGGPPPDRDTVFRIASMSKSFTASAVLLLRDEGRLALDDPAEKYVPELAAWPSVTADSDRVSIRHLLTMTAGLPTDDPWGDRQQGLPLEEFTALLAGGVSVNWPPGTRFEYSNMGYAILGLVIAAASGMEYASFVRTRLLEPLGLTRTGFAAREFDPAVLAVGYRRGMAGWEELPFDPYGAFAPMGGLFSSVTDLARWVTAFAPQMQLPQAVTGWRATERLPGGGPAASAYYGLGLFVDVDAAAGRVVSHSGGYPGFGSNMRWHPATGFGVIALGNATYANMSMLTALVFDALLPRSSSCRITPWPQTLTARDAVDRLLRSWDDAVADSVFSENVALDGPYLERRLTLDLIRERIGDFAPSSTRPAESDTPAHRRWWLAGERGTVQVQIQLTPERQPRVQSLTIAVPPAVGSPLAQALHSLLAWMNDGAGDVLAPVAVAPGVDAALLARRLRMAAVWAGPAVIAAFRSGDGSASVSAELAGEHARVILSLTVNPAGQLRQVDVTL